MKLIPVNKWGNTAISFRKSDRITNKPWFQGVLLLCCVVVAMLLANLPFTKDLYKDFLSTTIGLYAGTPQGRFSILYPHEMTVGKFINDILMTVFFFTVGLEIKREIAYGELSSPKKAALPIIAAFGGVLCPALIFTIINHGTASASGWGIPTATDIAFAVCILTVLGKKVPVSLKVFLTALAIADDLIAILVVAIFYGGHLNLPLLALSTLVIGAAILINKFGEKRGWPYIMLAIILWALFYYSGIHATMSGVVMAFLIPSTPRFNKTYFDNKWKILNDKFKEYDGMEGDKIFPSGPQRHYLREMDRLANGTTSMSYKVERALSPWVNFIIMPIFALANAGVEVSAEGLLNGFTIDTATGSVGLGIALGLVLGKPLGITLTSFIAIKCKIGEMPAKASWPMFFAVACLGGIGFTMSIFVDTLSFSNQLPEVTEALRAGGKVAVLIGSICAGIVGSLLVNLVYKLEHRN